MKQRCLDNFIPSHATRLSHRLMQWAVILLAISSHTFAYLKKCGCIRNAKQNDSLTRLEDPPIDIETPIKRYIPSIAISSD